MPDYNALERRSYIVRDSTAAALYACMADLEVANEKVLNLTAELADLRLVVLRMLDRLDSLSLEVRDEIQVPLQGGAT